MKLLDRLWRKSPLDPVVVRAGAILVREPLVFGADVHETCWRFVECVLTLEGIRCITIDGRRSLATVEYSANEYAPKAVLERMAAALSSDAPNRGDEFERPGWQGVNDDKLTVYRRDDASGRPVVQVSRPSRQAHGIRRLVYLALAGGSFGMSIVGILLPGIPTVPFLLLTSYYLVRSSSSLNERLLRSRTFGPLLRDWQDHGAMRAGVKIATLVIMVGVVTATVLFSDLSTPLLIVVVLLVGLGIYSVLRVPTLPGAASQQVMCRQGLLTQA